MFDCANVEMRELLPEFAAGSLDASTRARVEAHVQSCAECASELETLRLVRASFASVLAAAPNVDARRIAAALPKPVAPPHTSEAPRTRGVAQRRWVDWRVAAALTMITVGGLSVVVNERASVVRQPIIDTSSSLRPGSTAPVNGISVDPPSGAGRGDTRRAPTPNSAPVQPTRSSKAQLAFGGGGGDELDDASIQALL